MKTKIRVEKMGKQVKLSLVDGQDETASNLFANLVWLLTENERQEDSFSLTCSKEAFISAIKTFRAVNLGQSRRGKGLWKSAPFVFTVQPNRYNSCKWFDETYTQGSYQDDNEELETFAPTIAKHFDNVESKEIKKFVEQAA